MYIRITKSLLLRARGWMPWDQFRECAVDSLFSQIVRTGSRAYKASYVINIEVLSVGRKRQGREAEQSAPTSDEMKNGEIIILLPRTSSWCDAMFILRCIHELFVHVRGTSLYL
jgi:hypothetical protein